jgi:hypothetical protein
MSAEGRRLADDGGRRALTHAELQTMSWGDRAYRALLHFMERRPVFTIEQVKDYAYGKGLPKPPAPGAWGPVTKRAIRAGRLTFERFTESANATQHGKPVKVWRVK